MFLYPFFENIYIGTSKLYYLEKKDLKILYWPILYEFR